MNLIFFGATDYTGYGHVGMSFIPQLYNNPSITNIEVMTTPGIWDKPITHNDELAPLMRSLTNNHIEDPDLIYYLWNPSMIKQPLIETPQVIETMFEATRIIDPWVDKLNTSMEEIWVPSQFCKTAFEESGVEDVQLLPFGFDFWDTDEQIDQIANDSRFKFLFINQWSSRKFACETVQAFCETFNRDDNVVLYIRAFVLAGIGKTGADIIKDISKIKQENPDSPQVVVLDFFAEEKLPMLYNSIDMLLSPSRAEGLGRTIVEAMSMGVPAISTDWSAMPEFMNSDNGFLLDCSLVDIDIPDIEKKLYYFDDPRQQWAEPDFNQLCEYMSYAVDNPNEIKTLGEKAASDVRRQFSWDDLLVPRIERMNNLAEEFKDGN